MKKNILVISVIALAVVGIGVYLSARSPSPEGESKVISMNGLHWHPHLMIYVNGTPQGIPAGIGLGAVHNPVHTHDADGIIHLEFSGAVRGRDIALGRFFENWGRDMHSFGGNMRMTVNGAENSEYERYMMHDGDEIEIRYE